MSSRTITYSNREWEYKDWTIDFDAEASYIYEPMVRYYKDGSGYPGYEGIEDIDWTINSITDSDGNELQLGDDNYPVNWDDEAKRQLEIALANFLEDNAEWED